MGTQKNRLNERVLLTYVKIDGLNETVLLSAQNIGLHLCIRNLYGKCSKISNTLKLRTPKIIAENNF